MPASLSRSQNPIAILTTLLLSALMLCLTACNQNKSASTTDSQQATSGVATSSTPSESSSLPDPCQLITKAEAEAVLGEPVRDPEPKTLGGVSICDFNTVTVHGGVLPYYVHIAISRETQEVWDASKKLDAKDLRPVAGIGEDAYFLLDDLAVLSKQRSMTVGVMKDVDRPDHAKAVEEAEKIVAQKAISRM
jgi:Protein of unknown function (DUF3558)